MSIRTLLRGATPAEIFAELEYTLSADLSHLTRISSEWAIIRSVWTQERHVSGQRDHRHSQDFVGGGGGCTCLPRKSCQPFLVVTLKTQAK